jgi:putative ATPase
MARRKLPPESGSTLFSHAADQGRLGATPAPLADRMRPTALSEVVGQQHLLSKTGVLRRAIEGDRIPSMIFWGEPGCGKTTLAHVISRVTQAEFEPFSAVLSGVGELREIIARARERRQYRGRRTILFVDEIHRFNRAQQDAFLPHVENGTVVLVGATTENPSFAINAAVLSRAKVFRLKPLAAADLVLLLSRALSDERGYLSLAPQVEEGVLEEIAQAAGGDARRALNRLEAVVDLALDPTLGGAPSPDSPGPLRLTLQLLRRMEEHQVLLYDKGGEEHYNVSSALIKSMRGSDPDAAIYWLMRMVESGDDPLFILRRLMIFASEDVGNADPRALQVAVSADAAFRRMGMPEGLYPLAHACLYLACCPKSNSVGVAFAAARKAIADHGALPVPYKLRNAATSLMKEEGYGAGYQYAHDHQDHFVAGERYLPPELGDTRFYAPSSQGLEQAIGERLNRLRSSKGRSSDP